MGMNKFTEDRLYPRDITNVRNKSSFSVFKEVYIVSSSSKGATLNIQENHKDVFLQ